MTELRTVFFRNAAGEVLPVQLPPIEAANACGKHPHEWSTRADRFANPPEGFIASEGNGGGIGRVRGAGVRAD
ncbi:MAG TPA: hypothetical protein VFE60_10145 [Roseiarcus sp.]|jgi:hypothetical protein|nr:hypothetical protein [Roseiarcus sp.]